METIQNSDNQIKFDVMLALGVPTSLALHTLIKLNWQSRRAFARYLGQTHTRINSWVNGKGPNAQAAKVLGIKDPWS